MTANRSGRWQAFTVWNELCYAALGAQHELRMQQPHILAEALGECHKPPEDLHEYWFYVSVLMGLCSRQAPSKSLIFALSSPFCRLGYIIQ
jgi:hypothetical protein